MAHSALIVLSPHHPKCGPKHREAPTPLPVVASLHRFMQQRSLQLSAAHGGHVGRRQRGQRLQRRGAQRRPPHAGGAARGVGRVGRDGGEGCQAQEPREPGAEWRCHGEEKEEMEGDGGRLGTRLQEGRMGKIQAKTARGKGKFSSLGKFKATVK